MIRNRSYLAGLHDKHNAKDNNRGNDGGVEPFLAGK